MSHFSEKYLNAQSNYFDTALSEIKNGKKISHWMWFIFPQIKGLGSSDTTVYYAIKDRDEAKDYLQHPILGNRLLEITKALLELNETNAKIIMGSPDDLKLQSSMSLFALVSENQDTVFHKCLEKYFGGKFCKHTQIMLNK